MRNIKIETHSQQVHAIEISAEELIPSSGVSHDDEVIIRIHYPNSRPSTFRIPGYKFQSVTASRL